MPKKTPIQEDVEYAIQHTMESIQFHLENRTNKLTLEAEHLNAIHQGIASLVCQLTDIQNKYNQRMLNEMVRTTNQFRKNLKP